MKTALRSIDGCYATVELELDAVEVERCLAASLRRVRAEEGMASDDDPLLMVLSTAGAVSLRSDAAELIHAALAGAFAARHDELLERHGLFPLSAPLIQPVAEGVGGSVGAVARFEVPPPAEGLRYKGLRASYAEVAADGTEADAAWEALRRRHGGCDDGELLRRMGARGSLEELRASVESSIAARIDALNRAAKDEAAARALADANEVELPAGAVEAYVDGEVEKMMRQAGQEEFERCLAEGPHTLESLKAMVRRDAGHLPKLRRILGAIAARERFSVSDDDRLREVMAQRESALRPETLEPAEKTLAVVKKDAVLCASLDDKVRLNKAFDLVKSHMEFEVRMTVSLKERDPRAFI